MIRGAATRSTDRMALGHYARKSANVRARVKDFAREWAKLSRQGAPKSDQKRTVRREHNAVLLVLSILFFFLLFLLLVLVVGVRQMVVLIVVRRLTLGVSRADTRWVRTLADIEVELL